MQIMQTNISKTFPKKTLAKKDKGIWLLVMLVIKEKKTDCQTASLKEFSQFVGEPMSPQ
jgi:hypothetical protein